MRLEQRRINYVKSIDLNKRAKVLHEFLKKGTSMRDIERATQGIEESDGWNAWSIIHFYGFDKLHKNRYPNLSLKELTEQLLQLDDNELEVFYLSEDSPDKAVIEYNLKLTDEDGNDVFRNVKTRKGQSKLRKAILSNYQNKCALCQISNNRLLVTSHIKPWAESSKDERVDPCNVILLCKLHDALLENGFISFSDDLQVIYSPVIDFTIQGIATNLTFRAPYFNLPSLVYLEVHREKHGFS